MGLSVGKRNPLDCKSTPGDTSSVRLVCGPGNDSGGAAVSIDARIVLISRIYAGSCDTCSGSGKDPESAWDNCPQCHGATKDRPVTRLHLESRQRGGLAGQRVLTVRNAPSDMSGVLGTEIWGNASVILVRGRVWAKRHGYTEIELVEPQQ